MRESLVRQIVGSGASLAIAECASPVIVAVHGFCIGIGVLLVGAADLVVASPDATFTLAEIDYGATAGARSGDQSDARKAASRSHGIPVSVLRPSNCENTALSTAWRRQRIAGRSNECRRPNRGETGSVSARYEGLDRWLDCAADPRTTYRSEISYTYELNMLGVAAAARKRFFDET